jgi:hypothetical protein
MSDHEGATISMTVRVPPYIWQALRRLAEARALSHRGRPSCSAVVRELIEREAEAQRVKADA